jgi:hypothetical protein
MNGQTPVYARDGSQVESCKEREGAEAGFGEGREFLADLRDVQGSERRDYTPVCAF